MGEVVGSVWLGELFEKQAKFDAFVLERRSNGVHKSELCYETLNAYLVELGEFLNEVRAFKHWSDKRMSREEAFEEYIDGLHFLLSLGNTELEKLDVLTLENKIEELYASIIVDPRSSVLYYLEEKNSVEGSAIFVERSIELFTQARDLLSGDEDKFVEYFMKYISVGFSIGLTIGDIRREYERKNRINYERQLNGY